MFEFNQIFVTGLKNYLRSNKNILNSTMNLLYLFCFILRYYTMFVVSFAKKKITDPIYWYNLLIQNNSNYEDMFDMIYWLNAGIFV